MVPRNTLHKTHIPLVVVSCTMLQMSTFSIGGADDEDDFAELSNAKTAPASAKAGTMSTPGPVPLKTPAAPKVESSCEHLGRNELDYYGGPSLIGPTIVTING